MKGRNAQTVEVVHLMDNCFIRAAPSAAGAVLGVAKRGQSLPYGGRTTPEGWRLILYRGVPGWVTGRSCEAGVMGGQDDAKSILAKMDEEW